MINFQEAKWVTDEEVKIIQNNIEQPLSRYQISYIIAGMLLMASLINDNKTAHVTELGTTNPIKLEFDLGAMDISLPEGKVLSLSNYETKPAVYAEFNESDSTKKIIFNGEDNPQEFNPLFISVYKVITEQMLEYKP